MDVEHETRNLKLGLVLVLAFVVSAFVAYKELKFALASKTTGATLDRVYEQIGRRGSVTRRVQYHFHDDAGELRNASDSVPDNWSAPADGRLTIEYIAGSSRLAGHRNVFALVIFFACLFAMVVGVILFVRHVRQETHPPSAAGRR
jgi:hypothetical protein